MARAWTDEEARKFTAPCVDRHQWDAWLAAHDARVRRDAAREALDGLIDAWLGKYGTPETRDAGIAVRDYRETNYRLPEETP